MKRNAGYFALFITALLLITGCGEKSTTYSGRGVYSGLAFEGEGITINHEAIPGYMDAMEMDFRLKDRALIQDLNPGAIIAFTLEVKESGEATVVEVEELAPTTQLTLAPPYTEPSDTTAVDSAAAPGGTAPSDSATGQPPVPGHEGH